DVKAAEAIARINKATSAQQANSVFQPANPQAQAQIQAENSIIQPVRPPPPQQVAAQVPPRPAAKPRAPANQANYQDAQNAYPEKAAPLNASQNAPQNAPMSATPVAASVPVPSTLVGVDPTEAANEIKAVQRGLKALGYKVEKIDGTYGPGTANAI